MRIFLKRCKDDGAEMSCEVCHSGLHTPATHRCVFTVSERHGDRSVITEQACPTCYRPMRSNQRVRRGGLCGHCQRELPSSGFRVWIDEGWQARMHRNCFQDRLALEEEWMDDMMAGI